MQHKTEEEKADALTRWARGDDPQIIADELGIGLQTLKNWRKKAKEENFLANVHIGPKPSENVESIVNFMQKKQMGKYWETMSVPIASALVLNGHKIVNTKMGPDNKKIVIFEDCVEMQDLIRRFKSGELEGSLKNYEGTLYEVRTLVKS